MTTEETQSHQVEATSDTSLMTEIEHTMYESSEQKARQVLENPDALSHVWGADTSVVEAVYSRVGQQLESSHLSSRERSRWLRILWAVVMVTIFALGLADKKAHAQENEDEGELEEGTFALVLSEFLAPDDLSLALDRPSQEVASQDNLLNDLRSVFPEGQPDNGPEQGEAQELGYELYEPIVFELTAEQMQALESTPGVTQTVFGAQGEGRIFTFPLEDNIQDLLINGRFDEARKYPLLLRADNFPEIPQYQNFLMAQPPEFVGNATIMLVNPGGNRIVALVRTNQDVQMPGQAVDLIPAGTLVGMAPGTNPDVPDLPDAKWMYPGTYEDNGTEMNLHPYVLLVDSMFLQRAQEMLPPATFAMFEGTVQPGDLLMVNVNDNNEIIHIMTDTVSERGALAIEFTQERVEPSVAQLATPEPSNSFAMDNGQSQQVVRVQVDRFIPAAGLLGQSALEDLPQPGGSTELSAEILGGAPSNAYYSLEVGQLDGRTVAYTPFDAQDDPRYELVDGQLVDRHASRAEVEALYPQGMFETLSNLEVSGNVITWNSDLKGYQRQSDGAIWYPGHGTQEINGNYDQSDIEQGWVNMASQAVESSNFVPGESGLRIELGIGADHPLYSRVGVDSQAASAKGADAFTTFFLERYPQLEGRTVIVQILSEDIYANVNFNRPEDGVDATIGGWLSNGGQLVGKDTAFVRMSMKTDVGEEWYVFSHNFTGMMIASIDRVATGVEGNLSKNASALPNAVTEFNESVNSTLGRGYTPLFTVQAK